MDDDADRLAAKFEKKASVRAAAGGGRAGGRKSGGGGGGGKPGDGGKQREKQISMALSRLLRHQALNAGIKLDKEGYAPLDRVVSSRLLFVLRFLKACRLLSSSFVRTKPAPRVGISTSTYVPWYHGDGSPLCACIYPSINPPIYVLYLLPSGTHD